MTPSSLNIRLMGNIIPRVCLVALTIAVLACGVRFFGVNSLWHFFDPQPAINFAEDFSISPKLNEIPVETIQKAFANKRMPEAWRMYLALRKNRWPGINGGWFGMGQSRYDWKWLAQRHHINSDDVIFEHEFQGQSDAFQRLDRDGNGRISAEDLNWSEESSWIQQSHRINFAYYKVFPSGDGVLSNSDWEKLQSYTSRYVGRFTIDALKDLWLAGMASDMNPIDHSTPERLMDAFLSGDAGYFNEGPQVNEQAPEFALGTQDGQETFRLSDHIGDKPIVIVFGSFSCGGFRSIYPYLDRVQQKYEHQAAFYAIYIREAHPTNGWALESNRLQDIQIEQPITLTSRVSTVQHCLEKWNTSLTMLIDEIDDSTSRTYSAFPMRLYIIDRSGRISYKSGRGPFGFRIGEMEQALIMTLMDQS